MKNIDEEIFNDANNKKKRNEKKIPGIILLIEIFLIYFAFEAYGANNKILFFIFFVCMILILFRVCTSWKSLLKLILEGIVFAVILIVISFGMCFLIMTSMA